MPRVVSSGRAARYLSGMESAMDWHAARAALEWQLDCGIDETLGETPVDRFAAEAALRAPPATVAQAPASDRAAGPARAPAADPVAEAEALAQRSPDLAALRDALAGFEHCALKKGARNLVFADGTPGASVMIVGEAPGRDEDMEGRPFVGRAGRLLDRMLAAIGLSRDDSVYITNILPWRPPQNRDPKPDEIAMMLPFVRRHIALADPEIVVVMGNISAQALLGKRGITRLRGQWTRAADRPCLPMVHPAYLLRNPHAKRDAWADLLSLRSRLRRPAGDPDSD